MSELRVLLRSSEEWLIELVIEKVVLLVTLPT